MDVARYVRHNWQLRVAILPSRHPARDVLVLLALGRQPSPFWHEEARTVHLLCCRMDCLERPTEIRRSTLPQLGFWIMGNVSTQWAAIRNLCASQPMPPRARGKLLWLWPSHHKWSQESPRSCRPPTSGCAFFWDTKIFVWDTKDQRASWRQKSLFWWDTKFFFGIPATGY